MKYDNKKMDALSMGVTEEIYRSGRIFPAFVGAIGNFREVPFDGEYELPPGRYKCSTQAGVETYYPYADWVPGRITISAEVEGDEQEVLLKRPGLAKEVGALIDREVFQRLVDTTEALVGTNFLRGGELWVLQWGGIFSKHWLEDDQRQCFRVRTDVSVVVRDVLA